MLHVWRGDFDIFSGNDDHSIYKPIIKFYDIENHKNPE